MSKNQVTISVGQVQADLIANLKVYFGGSITYVKRPESNRQNVYHWTLYSGHAIALMFSIYTFMSPKRQLQIEKCVAKWKTQRVCRLTHTHCVKGHLIRGDNLILEDGYRRCRRCKNAAQREYIEKNKVTMCQDLTKKE